MKTLALLEITSPDYFSGYHRTVLMIPVQPRMSYIDVSDELDSEFDAMYDCMKATHSKTEMLIIDECITEFRERGEELYFQAVDCSSFNEDTYMYFGLIKPNYSNGVIFCE